ncbi:MAG: His-Xaa-Ser system protein HxsD [Elusimicrobia bacterium]|nr:His-Xaa-Ser system protein HxsD [Elusimicrobiota bacterium]
MAKTKTGVKTETELELEERLYPLEAVQAAAYAFTDRAYARVETAGEGRLRVVLAFKPATSAAARAALAGELRNELLHQALRHKVSQANQKIREFIVTKALVSALPASAKVASAEEPCKECTTGPDGAPGSAAAHAPLDAELEGEIDRLLKEIDSGSGADDPLGVTSSWEEKFGPAGEAQGDAKKEGAA